jgi:hypothetical protein
MRINPEYTNNPSTPDNWPLVDLKDDGIRSAGEPDECFYCNQKIGQPHGPDCVCVKKKVRVTYVVTATIEVPHSWCAEQIVACENHDGWGFNIAEWGNAQFDNVECSFIETVDETPSRLVNDDDEEEAE